MTEAHGYAFVHFVEDPSGHGERVYLSRSDDERATHWHRLNGGRPILESTIGTTGVRDPFIIRTDSGFVLVATDLRIYGGDGAGWDAWTRWGSRSILIWESPDLLTWSPARLAEVAPPEAGMAWAPEAVRDPNTGEFLVFWSSTLYESDDGEHLNASYSRILVSRTRDFRQFSPAEVLVDEGKSVIDMTVIVEGERIHRFLKEDQAVMPLSRRVYQETGSGFFADDFRLIAAGIGHEFYASVEAPIVFHSNTEPIWYLFIDQFHRYPQGYFAMWTDDLVSGNWTRLADDEFQLPENTKHGTVISLTRAEWDALEVNRLER